MQNDQITELFDTITEVVSKETDFIIKTHNRIFLYDICVGFIIFALLAIQL
jgi:hypothetical protein